MSNTYIIYMVAIISSQNCVLSIILELFWACCIYDQLSTHDYKLQEIGSAIFFQFIQKQNEAHVVKPPDK